jgi:hypothetical protein
MMQLILIRNFAKADKMTLRKKLYRILLKIAAEFTFVCYFNENQRNDITQRNIIYNTSRLVVVVTVHSAAVA